MLGWKRRSKRKTWVNCESFCTDWCRFSLTHTQHTGPGWQIQHLPNISSGAFFSWRLHRTCRASDSSIEYQFAKPNNLCLATNAEDEKLNGDKHSKLEYHLRIQMQTLKANFLSKANMRRCWCFLPNNPQGRIHGARTPRPLARPTHQGTRTPAPHPLSLEKKCLPLQACVVHICKNKISSPCQII